MAVTATDGWTATDSTQQLAPMLAGMATAVLVPVAHGAWLLPTVAGLPLLATSARPLGAFGLGVWVALLLQGHAIDHRPEVSPRAVWTVTAQVVSLPEADNHGQRVVVEPIAIDGWQQRLPRRIRVAHYDDQPELAAGEVWRLPLRLRRPRGFANPTGFDYEHWLAGQRIDALAVIAESRGCQRLRAATGLPAWRSALIQRLDAVLDGAGQGGALIKGLVAGDRRDFSDQTWAVLRASGTSHLVAISGLHIGLLAALGYALGRGMAGLAPMRINRRGAGLVMAIIAAGGYAALSGFALPTQRAVMMVAAAGGIAVLGVRLRASSLLALVATVVVVLDPAVLLGAGFWLSFGAVVLISAALRGHRSGVTAAIRLQWVLTLGLMPLTGVFFGHWSPAGLLVNLLVLPLFTLVFVPLILSVTALLPLMPSLAAPALEHLAMALEVLLEGGAWLQAHGMTVVPLASPGLTGGVASIVAVLLVVAPAGTPGRGLALALFGLLVVAKPEPPPPGALRVTWLEVGQGNAAVIETHGRVTVVDTGPAWGAGAAAADYTLVPFLESKGIERIDHLIVTHGDRDHRGGVMSLQAHFDIGEIEAGDPLAALPRARRCLAGRQWRQDSVSFRYLWPPAGFSLRGNKGSCVLLIEAAGRRFLLAGDIDRAIEQELLADGVGPVDVIEAAHHGSRSSTSAGWIEALQPDHAIISAGFRNRHGMPHPQVLQRLWCADVRWHDTGRVGAVTISVEPSGRWQLSRHRVAERRILNATPRRPRFRDKPPIPYYRGIAEISPTEAFQALCSN
jgi:competence protein ComEC